MYKRFKDISCTASLLEWQCSKWPFMLTCWFVDDCTAHGHLGAEGQALDGVLEQQGLDKSNDDSCKGGKGH